MRRLATGLACIGAACAAAAFTYANYPKNCRMDAAPVINVDYDSQDVRYDLSQSAASLSGMRSDTRSPYAPGTRTETEGLRRDRPVIDIRTQENVVTFPMPRLMCMSYGRVDIHIGLHPVILIAREWPPGPCRDAIFEHEQKHISVDHQVTEAFIPRIRDAVRRAVEAEGPLGPLPQDDEKLTQDMLEAKIHHVVEDQLDILHNEMERHQATVDNLREYERVNRVCDRERQNNLNDSRPDYPAHDPEDRED